MILDTLAVVAGPVLIVGVILYFNTMRNIEHLRKNWVQYRCNPLYMPFVPLLTDKVTIAENFQFCANSMADTAFGYITDPIYKAFEMVHDLVESFMQDIQHFLTYLAGMDSFIFAFADKIFGTLGNSMSVLMGQMGRIRDIFSRITASAYYAAFVAQTLIEFVMSLFNFMMTLLKTVVIMIFAVGIILSLFYPIILAFFLPLGTLFGLTFYCFHPDTVVHTSRGDLALRDVRLGDSIGDETGASKVTGIFHFDCPNYVPLYKYNGVIVSGRHLVRHNGVWMYVEDTGAPEYHWERPSKLVCLNTSDHNVYIRGTVFRDYEEIGGDHPPALHPDTLVTLSDGVTQIPFTSVQVGTQLVDGRVTGVVQLDTQDSDWYIVDGRLMTTGSQLLDTEEFGYVTARTVGIPICAPQYGLHIFIDNKDGWFQVDDIYSVRDYPDSHNETVLAEIQREVLVELNGTGV